MKVDLFTSCLVDQFYPEVAEAAVTVLQQAGVKVIYNPLQTCCGQPAYNSGFRKEAQSVANHLLEVFFESEAIVVPSGSCAAMIKVFIPRVFADDVTRLERAREVAAKTWEFSDFLVTRLNIRSVPTHFPHVVTFHDSCHQLRELGIRAQPRKLLRAVKDIDFRELEDSERCCGFGGLFSVKFAPVSAAIGEDKVEAIKATGADYIVSNDVSCLMHLDGLLKRKQVPVRTIHLAQLLAHN